MLWVRWVVYFVSATAYLSRQLTLGQSPNKSISQTSELPTHANTRELLLVIIFIANITYSVKQIIIVTSLSSPGKVWSLSHSSLHHYLQDTWGQTYICTQAKTVKYNLIYVRKLYSNK